MTTEEKIDEIHKAVMALQAEREASKTICAATHKAIDDRLNGLHKKIVGNGQPGLEQKQADLTSRFDKFETRVALLASAVLFLGQVFGPKILSAMGLN